MWILVFLVYLCVHRNLSNQRVLIRPLCPPNYGARTWRAFWLSTFRAEGLTRKRLLRFLTPAGRASRVQIASSQFVEPKGSHQTSLSTKLLSPHLAGSIIWRRERDSNPRWAFYTHTPLAGERLQPLGHLSRRCLLRPYRSKPIWLLQSLPLTTRSEPSCSCWIR